MSKYKSNPLPLEELMSLPSYSFPELSYDKSKLAFYWDKTGRIELHVLDIAKREKRQLSEGEVPRAPRSGLTWDRETKQIFFGKDVGGNEQHDIWSMDLNGEIQVLTETPDAQEIVGSPSHDNEWLSFISTRSGQMNVHIMKLDGSDVKQLSASDIPVTVGKWSPNDKLLIMSTNEMKTNLENNDIYLYNFENEEMERIVRMSEEGSHDYFNDWGPDGKTIAFQSDVSGLNQVGLFNLKSQEITWLSDKEKDENRGLFSPNGKYLATLVNDEATIRPVIYDLKSEERIELPLPPGNATIIDFYSDEKLLLSFIPVTKRPEILLYNFKTKKMEILLEAEYGSIDPKRFVEPDYIRYDSPDGTKIPAIVYKPKDIPKGVKLPAIVNVHGGPTGQYFRAFDARGQYLASEGFVLILPNVRGSTGYGVDFRDACIKDWGGKDLEDVVGAAEYLKKQPYIDNDRIAVAGGSYGGFMTYLAMTKKPDHWKAGFAWIGISDLISMYGESMPHFKYFLERQMGHPSEEEELWKDRSAVNFAEQMTGKMLIFHGVSDPRCPVSQARIFRDKLLKLGKVEGEDFEYEEIEEVGHGGYGDIKTRIHTIKKMTDFFKRNL
jgi:dipeptidyl aminopeptidase/acylaminoacyl peptidase